MTQYPEHEKMQQFQQDAIAIREFLDRLDEYGLTLVDSEGDGFGRLFATSRSMEHLVLRHFGVDPVKMEAERKEMLAEFTRQNEDRVITLDEIPLDRQAKDPYDGIMWGDGNE